MDTNKKYNEIWELAKPYLEKGKMKDFILHTKGVAKAMELLLQKENGDNDILIPSAILHDVGWAKVPTVLQKSNNKKEKIQALKLHIEYAPKIVRKILSEIKYDEKQIKTIIEIIVAHKFKNPIRLDKRLLIDADNLSDIFKEQFYSDAKSYNVTPEQNYDFRKNDNTFYTKTAKIIFDKELKKRKQEFKISKPMPSMIVIVGKNREIGYKNKLLWDIPEDMARFKKLTTGHVVAMGDKTFESIGKPLPNRTNIIITKDKNYKIPEGCFVAHSIEEVKTKAKELDTKGEVFIIGGGTIYKLFLPLIDKLYITEVDDAPEADTFFPDYSEFKKIIFEETHETDGLKFTFKELKR